MPTAFFKSRPEMGGVREGEFTAMCTSHPAVRQWMGDALTYVFRQVPDLGGVYAITASENLTNCASHGALAPLPALQARSDADILAEVVAAIEEGVHRGNPKATSSSPTGAGKATATPRISSRGCRNRSG